jgi:hypothetical protein
VAGDDLVVLDGVERATDHRRVSIPWAWLATGFASGVLFAVVFVGPVLESHVEEADPGALSAEGETTGVANAVSGFPDPLIAIVETEARSFQLVRWPVNGPETRHPIPAGDFGEVSIDVSGHWVAATTPVPGVDWVVLSVGRSTGVFPLASGVTSFSWHDSEEGALAFTRHEDEGWSLWRVGGDRHPIEVATVDGVDWSLVSWGEWGYALGDPEGPSVLLSPDGDLRGTSFDGTLFDSTSDGWLFGVGAFPAMVSAGGGVRQLDVSLDAIGEVEAAAIDPTGQKVAMLGSVGLLIFDEDGEPRVTLLKVGVGRKVVSWTSDGRFVLVPGFRGVLVYDTEELSQELILPGDVVEVVVAARDGT